MALTDGTSQPTQADILSAFGVTAPAAPPTPPPAGDPPPAAPDGGEGAPPATPPAQPPTVPPAEGGTKEGQEGGDPNDQTGKPPKPQGEDRSAAKFAEMRVQLRQFESVISDIAQVLGLPETKDQNELVSMIKEAVIAAQSKKTGIAEDVLRQQKQNSEELQQLRLQTHVQQTYSDLGKLQADLKLTPVEVNEFVERLVEQGRNPFQMQLELEKEYRLLNFDKILDKERKAAVAAEQERATRANQHASSPDGRQGNGGGGEKTSITSVKDLDKFMETLKI